MAAKVASLFGVLSLDDKDFVKTLGVAKSGILDVEKDLDTLGGGLSSAVNRVGTKLTEIGGQMTVLGESIQTLLGPLLEFGAGAVAASTTFDESMANAQAAAGYTAEEMTGIRDQVLAIGEASRYGPAVVAEAFYEVAGGVTDASARMAVLEASVKAAQAGNADLASTTSAMIGIMNSYGFSAEQAGFASDVLTRTVGMGKGSMDEFGTALAKAAMLAPGLNIGLDDLASSMAYMTTKNIPAAESATMLKSMMTTLLNPTEDLADAIHKAGYASGEAMIKAEGLTGAYKILSENNGGTLNGLITNVEALTGATTLASDEFTKFDETFKGSEIKTWNGQTGSAAAMTTFTDGIKGATDAAQGVQMSTAASQFDLLSSSMEALNITVGETLTPTLVDLTQNTIGPLITEINKWVGANPQAALTIMLVVAAVGALGFALTVAGTAVTAIGTALTVLSGPIGLAILAVAALALAYSQNLGGIKDFVEGTVAPVVSDFIETLRSIWDVVGPGVTDLATFFLSGTVQNMVNVFKFILGAAKAVIDVLRGIWDAVRPGVQGLADGIRKFLGPIEQLLQSLHVGIENIKRTLQGDSYTVDTQPIPGGKSLNADQAALDAIYASAGNNASGGQVYAGDPTWVGERGREIFVPSTDGTIIPNRISESMMGGGSGVSISIGAIYANDAAGGRAAAEAFGPRLKEILAARG